MAWDLFNRMSEIQKREGMLVPVMLAAKVLNVSRTRIDQLVEAGSLNRIEVDGHVFLTENSVVAFAKTERKAGRPSKPSFTLSDAMDAAKNGLKKS